MIWLSIAAWLISWLSWSIADECWITGIMTAKLVNELVDTLVRDKPNANKSGRESSSHQIGTANARLAWWIKVEAGGSC